MFWNHLKGIWNHLLPLVVVPIDEAIETKLVLVVIKLLVEIGVAVVEFLSLLFMSSWVSVPSEVTSKIDPTRNRRIPIQNIMTIFKTLAFSISYWQVTKIILKEQPWLVWLGFAWNDYSIRGALIVELRKQNYLQLPVRILSHFKSATVFACCCIDQYCASINRWFLRKISNWRDLLIRCMYVTMYQFAKGN